MGDINVKSSVMFSSRDGSYGYYKSSETLRQNKVLPISRQYSYYIIERLQSHFSYTVGNDRIDIMTTSNLPDILAINCNVA